MTLGFSERPTKDIAMETIVRIVGQINMVSDVDTGRLKICVQCRSVGNAELYENNLVKYC